MKMYTFRAGWLFLFLTILATGIIISTSCQAQVIYDGNGAAGSVGSTTLAFTVPAGTNRLLVISLANSTAGGTNPITDVSFNGTSASLAATESYFNGSIDVSIYYIPLGTGAAINDTISVTGGGNHHIKAASFQNINQASPYSGNSDGLSGTSDGASINPVLSVTSTAGNLVVDNIAAAANRNPVPGAGQIDIASLDAAAGADYYSTYMIAAGSPTAMSYTLADVGLFNTSYVYVAAEFTNAPAGSIPTLSEWGMVIFSLLLGGIAIRYMRKQSHGRNMT